MKPSAEERERSHRDWIESLHDARAHCRQALMQATVDVSDPERALWPAVPRSHMTREHQTVAQAHASLLDYAEHVEPFSNRCSHAWTVPFGGGDFALPEGERLPLALADIEEWADLRYALEVGGESELSGTQTQVVHRRVHVPIIHARQAFRQLNKCLDRLQLAVDLDNPVYPTEEEDGGLTHE